MQSLCWEDGSYVRQRTNVKEGVSNSKKPYKGSFVNKHKKKFSFNEKCVYCYYAIAGSNDTDYHIVFYIFVWLHLHASLTRPETMRDVRGSTLQKFRWKMERATFKLGSNIQLYFIKKKHFDSILGLDSPTISHYFSFL